MRFRKGQTAMEYLMTYGWAILVIMVVLAVLFYLGILNPRGITPTQCSFPAGLTCITWKLYTTGGLYLKIGQGTGRTINITGVVCTMNSSYVPGGTIYYNPQPTNQILVPSASQAVIADTAAGLNLNINCTNEQGQLITGTIGDSYNGKLYVNYTETDTGLQRITTGSISAKYEV